ncbi:MAG: hypothetical protein ACL93V_03085 [Candidatus Electrothrix sp. YB6]
MSFEIAYIFPDTLPDEALVFPLVQLVDRVVFLRPAENDEPEAEELTPFLREMTEQQCISSACPAPLRQDRDRFMQLLQDIRSRPDDYAGHLSSLSAGFGSIGSIGERQESEHAIMETLLAQTGIRAPLRDTLPEPTPEPAKGQEEKQRSLLLWQARLLLKLGETVDRSRAEIRRNLDALARREKTLLQDLRQEQETGQLLSAANLGEQEEMSAGQQRLRLKAWARLFAAGEQPPQSAVFITRSANAFETLFDHFEHSRETARPEQLLTLSLPAILNRDGRKFMQQRCCFQEAAAELLRLFSTAIHAQQPLTEKAEKEMQDEWAALLEQHYPAGETGRCRLSLYSVPESTPQKLFVETFAPGDNRADRVRSAGTEEKGNKGNGTVIGLLEV